MQNYLRFPTSMHLRKPSCDWISLQICEE